jgi:hypothetical protein
MDHQAALVSLFLVHDERQHSIECAADHYLICRVFFVFQSPH